MITLHNYHAEIVSSLHRWLKEFILRAKVDVYGIDMSTPIVYTEVIIPDRLRAVFLLETLLMMMTRMTMTCHRWTMTLLAGKQFMGIFLWVLCRDWKYLRT